MDNIYIDLHKILDIGIALTTEKDYNKLFELILKEAMNITSSDAGTIYVYENDTLVFKIMQNNSLKIYDGGDGKKIDLPPVPLKKENICAYSAICKKVVNIPDVSSNTEFDFSGPKKYDAITGYNTKSLLVIPLLNHENEVLGVIQLINALDSEGNIVPYEAKYEYIMSSLASQAAVSLSNMRHLHDIKELLYSFVSVITTAIDERTPYNANHTKNVAKYVSEFVDYLNSQYELGTFDEYFSEIRKEQLILTAYLHDIGKLIIPLDIMNKSTKLGDKLEKIISRFDLIKAYIKIDYLEGRISKENLDNDLSYLDDSINLIKAVNSSGFLSDDLEKRIIELASHKYISQDTSSIYYLNDDEKECLLIKKGTLTDSERDIMENHVSITFKLLKKIKFKSQYEKIPFFAGSHHEYLDGSGYPNHLTAKDIPIDVRILVIIDIFDALTSKDRPYKSPIPNEKALSILISMADEGKLDKRLVELFGQYALKF